MPQGKSKDRFEKVIMGIFLVLCMGSLLFPIVFKSYVIRTLAEFYFFLVMTYCFNILGGKTGYFNLGQGVFVGIGAYGTAVGVHAGLPSLAALILATFVGVSWAFLCGPILFRLRGTTFALVNLTLLFIFLAAAMRFRHLTGGTDGLFIDSSGNLTLAYCGQCVLVFVVSLVALGMPGSRIGTQAQVMGEDPFLAESIGIPTLKVNITLFMLCAVLLSAAGGFFVLEEGYLIPSTVFGLQISLLPVAMAMVGGLGSTLGALWGTLLVFGLMECLWVYVGSMEQALLGLMLILAGKRKAIFQRTLKLFQ